MKKRLLAIMALLLLASSFTLVQGQTYNNEMPKKSSTDNDNTALYMASTFHFEKGNFTYRPVIQYGTYLTKHLSWMFGVGYDMNRVKFQTMDLSGNTITQKIKTRTLTLPLTLRYGFGSDVHFAQLHAGVSYNYITSMRIGGVKQDLSGLDRGYFSGHVRLTALMLFFLEYEYVFNGGGSIFYYGLCIDL